MQSKISIIIPLYNSEKYIRSCIDSVLGQTFADWELILCDDGSTDSTLQIINEYCKSYKNISLYQNAHKGPGWERNFGLRKAKGEYIAFMDHDDWVEPIWLETLYNSLVTNNADVSYCSNADYYDETGKLRNYSFSKKLLGFSVLTEQEKCGDLCNVYFAPWRRLIKKEVVINNDIRFAEGDFKFDDVLFTQELIECTSSVFITNEILYYHRIFDESITGKGFHNHDMFMEHLATVHELEIWAEKNNKNISVLVKRMIPFLITYFKYVNSTKLYYDQLKMIIKNDIYESKKYVFKVKIVYAMILTKRFIKKILHLKNGEL